MSIYKQKVKDFYASHPYHIKVDTEELLKKYSGLEEELWLSILAKYPEYHDFEKELSSLAREAGVTVNSTKVKSFLEANPNREAAALEFFYRKNCLSQATFVKRKLKEVYKNQGSDFKSDDLVDRFKGNEAKLVKVVGAKYLTGASPAPAKSDVPKPEKPAPAPTPAPETKKEEFKPLREVYEERKKTEPAKPTAEAPKPKEAPTPVPAKPVEAKATTPASTAKVEEKPKTAEADKTTAKPAPAPKKGGIPRGVIIAGQVLLVLVAVVAIAFGVYVATDMRIAAIDKLLGNTPSVDVEEKVEELKTVKSEGSEVTASEFFSEEELREMAEQEAAEE